MKMEKTCTNCGRDLIVHRSVPRNEAVLDFRVRKIAGHGLQEYRLLLTPAAAHLQVEPYSAAVGRSPLVISKTPSLAIPIASATNVQIFAGG